MNPVNPLPDFIWELWQRVPEHIQPGLMSYLKDHQKPGQFLLALLRNDLSDAVGRADPVNIFRLREILEFLHNCAPANSWGSYEKVDAWLKAGVR